MRDFEASLTALQTRAPLDLRVNIRKATVAQVQASLGRDDIETNAVANVPNALRVIKNPRRVALSKAYQDGLVEIQDAGASLLVLECVPAPLAADISEKLRIPVIGIGAGAGTDAQVLVMHDMLGLSEHSARFVENFMEGRSNIQDAFSAFVTAVKNGDYPREEHGYE